MMRTASREIGSIPVMLLLCVTGCGENKFQQEVHNEELAVNLAREVVDEDTGKARYKLITTEELKKLLDDKTDIVLIDAMPYESSYKKSHIAGAKQFLFSKDEEMKEWDEGRTGGKPQSDYKQLLGEDLDKPVVVYCGYVKCLRSHNAALWAKKLGYTKVKRYAGGIYAWKGAGHPTEAE